MGCRCTKDYVKVSNTKFFTLNRIAEGGFGVIDLVEDSNNELYALKRIKCSTKEDADKVSLENSYYKRFNNTNIIKLLFDDVIEDHIHSVFHVYLVFPFYKNGTLHDELELCFKKSTYLSDEQVIRLMIGLCNALIDIHKANLAHRDLKTQNILLSDDKNTSILTDFGSMSEKIIEINDSKKAQEVQDWAAENCSMFYKAPELFFPNNSNGKITEKADIWSFGCNLYAAMYGKGPFDYVAEKGDSIALAVNSARYIIPTHIKRPEKLINIIKNTIICEQDKRLKLENIMLDLVELSANFNIKLSDNNIC